MPYAKEEGSIKLGNGSEVRFPAYPNPCDYVRLVDGDEEELVYWDEAEWQEAPAEVMGSILGMIQGGK